MSETSTREYTEKMRGRYGRVTGKSARTRLIDEYVAVTRYERKYAIKVLRGTRRRAGAGRHRGSPKRYDEATDRSLKRLWLAMDQSCCKRMKDMLPLWLDHSGEKPAMRKRLLAMGASTIDRHLAAAKVNGPKKRLPPRSDAAIRSLVEIRAESWDAQEVGWTEVDTVAHCGGDMGGSPVASKVLTPWRVGRVRLEKDVDSKKDDTATERNADEQKDCRRTVAAFRQRHARHGWEGWSWFLTSVLRYRMLWHNIGKIL